MAGMEADQADAATLRRTLYGSVRPEDLTPAEADQMVAAARRRLERQRARVERQRQLLAMGVVARLSLTPLIEEVDSRRRELDLAESRAALFNELMSSAQAEADAARAEMSVSTGSPLLITERYDGNGLFRPSQFQTISREFIHKFGKPLPVSAYGETAVHRSLGFDHRGRVDVAVDPDSPEGIWLRTFLESVKIPYYAFRGAIPGKSTAAHIHIGPPSLRLGVAD